VTLPLTLIVSVTSSNKIKKFGNLKKIMYVVYNAHFL